MVKGLGWGGMDVWLGLRGRVVFTFLNFYIILLNFSCCYGYLLL